MRYGYRWGLFFTLYAYGGGIIGNVSVVGWVVYLAVFRIMVDGRELMSLHGEEIVGISIVGLCLVYLFGESGGI